MEKFLKELLETPTPSSCEGNGVLIWENKMKNLGLSPYYRDKLGNVGYHIGTGPKKILLSAHIDEICMSVQDISDDGYITVISLCGIDPKILPGSQVLISDSEGKNWISRGLFCKQPIHSEDRESRNETIKIEDMRISVGADSKKDVENLGIRIGSLVVLDRNINLHFGENKLHGNGLDDKIGIYIITQIAMRAKKNDNYTFIFLCACQEETGLRGMTVAAKNINPDISIDIDVTPAIDGDLGVKKEIWGNIKLGEGCVIEYGPDKSRRIAHILENEKIKTQSCCSPAGGTNTDPIQMFSKDCETMLISIPNINMHTQNEICDWRDIESAIDLISGVLNSDKL